MPSAPGTAVSRIDVQRRWHRHSRTGGQAAAGEEGAGETAGPPRAAISLAIEIATAAESEKQEMTTGGGSRPDRGVNAMANAAAAIAACFSARGIGLPMVDAGRKRLAIP